MRAIAAAEGVGRRHTPSGSVSGLVDLTLAAWVLLEVAVRVREGIEGKGRRDRDRATRVWIALARGAAIALALTARS